MMTCLRQSGFALGSLNMDSLRFGIESQERRPRRFEVACAQQSRKKSAKGHFEHSTGRHAKRQETGRRAELENARPLIRNYLELMPEEIDWLQRFFKAEVELVLTPWAVDAGRRFPNIEDHATNIVAVVQNPETESSKLAIVSVPKCLSRWIKVPTLARRSSPALFVCIEEVIVNNLDQLYGGMRILMTSIFQVIPGVYRKILHVEDTMPVALTEVLAYELNVDISPKPHGLRCDFALPSVKSVETPRPMLSDTVCMSGVVSLSGGHRVDPDVLYSLTRKSRLRHQASKVELRHF